MNTRNEIEEVMRPPCHVPHGSRSLDSAIEPVEIRDSSIEPVEIRDSSIEPVEIRDSSIEPVEIRDSSIEPVEIRDSSIEPVEILGFDKLNQRLNQRTLVSTSSTGGPW